MPDVIFPLTLLADLEANISVPGYSYLVLRALKVYFLIFCESCVSIADPIVILSFAWMVLISNESFYFVYIFLFS